MSMEDEYNVAARYRTVRKHLDSLGYKQALTLDALPLIEKLLADLIQTTESLKHFKSIAQENIEAHTQLQSTIDPYKCDNVRLVQECNQLHLDLMKEKESHQKQIKDFKKETNKLERECNDLQLVSSRNLHRIKELETESARKSKRILELQGKCLKPTISNVGLASKKRPVFPLRRPILEGEPLLKAGTKSSPLPNLGTADPKVVDLLSMADHKMNFLSHEVTKLNEELSLQNDNVQTLKHQLTSKEKEILRLRKMLEGGRPYSAVSRDCVCKKGENSYAMSGQSTGVNELKAVQQEKLELEQRLEEALNKQHDAMTQALKLADRNEELEKELRDIDHIALAVEADCNSAVKENNKRVSKLQEKLEDVMTRIHLLEGELTVERREVQELRADLEACKLEKLNIQRNLESALDEKKYMSDKINELTVIEKNLNEEIGRMAAENEKQRQDIIQLQYSNKILKDQLNSKQILLDESEINLRLSKEKGKKNDYNRGQNSADLQELYKEREILSNGSYVGYNSIIKQLEQKESDIGDLQLVVEQLRRERDFYKNEYNSFKDNFAKTSDKEHMDMWSQVREVKRQLSEKEKALDEVQREKKELFREKTSLEARLQNYKAEHKSHCRLCNVCTRGAACNCSPSMRDVGKTKSVIERLEHERDIARADVDRLIEERDALRERLKMATEAHASEQRRLRENLTDVETRLKQIEKERQELSLAQGTRRATINGLEGQLQDLREELRRTKQELGTQRTQYFQLRALHDQTDQALDDAQNQLTQSESELNKALDRNRTMERQQQQLESQVRELQQEIHNFEAKMAHLDHEKDQLLMALDEKTEKIATLEREIMLKEQQVMGSEHQIRELQHKNELCVDQSTDQERQLRSIQLEMENLQRQLQTVTYDRENAIQENRRVQDDLAAVTCEVRNLQRELEASRVESSDLKRQLQTYVSEVRRAEDLLNRKENERTEMLNHFRSLSLEATVLENNNHSLESEAAEARGALQSVRDRMLDLERQLADKDSLIRGYETQISELTQSVASMETQLCQQGEQKHRAEADLSAVRGLCVKLDQQKDTLMQQLDDKDALKTQYDMQIAKLKAEQAVIQDQMSKDRATVERLELLLDQARQESITVQANNQELQNEMSRLRSKMSELQSKLSSESSKLRQYQTQAAEYCKQISELRRQVTNERFDRARAEEENRRQSEGLPDSLAQVPCPTYSVPNESNDAKNRYLQSETCCKSGGQMDRSGMKIMHPLAISRSGQHLNGDSNCNYTRTKEFQRDVPCINIILRSDCKVHSNMYNCVHKDQADHSSSVRRHTEMAKTGLESSSDASQCNKCCKKYDDSARDTDTRLSFPQSTKIQCCEELSSFNPIAASSFKSQLFSKVNGTNLEQTPAVINSTVKALNVSATKLDSSLKGLSESSRAFETASNFLYSLETPDADKQDFIKTPDTKVQSILKNPINYNETEFKPESANTINNSRMTEDRSRPAASYRSHVDSFRTPASIGMADRNYNSLKNPKFQSAILTKKEYPCDRNTCDKYNSQMNRETSTCCTNTLETKKLTDWSIQENGEFCIDTKCIETDCPILNSLKQSEDSNKITGTKFINCRSYKFKRNFCQVDCDNKCISTIDSALDMLQQMLREVKKCKGENMKKYNAQDTMYDRREVRCKNMKCNYPYVKTEVALQNATSSSLHSVDVIKPECMKMLQQIKKNTQILEDQLTIMNKRAKRKLVGKLKYISENGTAKQQRDIVTQNPEKKNIYVQEPCWNDTCNKDPSQTINGKCVREENLSVRDKNIKKINTKLLKSANASKEIRDAQTNCQLSLSYHTLDSSNMRPIASSNMRPIASSTPKTLNLTSYTQTNSVPTRNMQTLQFEKTSSNEQEGFYEEGQNLRTDSVNSNEDETCSNCDDGDVKLLLTKSVCNSRCLKSKYKKMEFLNFRPKCISNSCVTYDHKSVRCKLSRRRLQIPIVFKLKSVSCKSNCEDNCHRIENVYKHSAWHATKRDGRIDLETTVHTQSSDLQITTATSVPSIPFNYKYPPENCCTNTRPARKDGCIIC